MATPFRIKRSAVPGKAPLVNDLQTGELALNTYDNELYTLRSRPGIGTDVVRVGSGVTVTNILYVTKDGKDTNTGKKLGDAKATIAGAVAAATEGTVIKVAAGTYVENNPIALPPQVSIIGSSLREVTVTPQNPGDLFHVAPGNYISDMSFSGTSNPGGAIAAFDPNKVYYYTQSPYVRNCTNFIPDSIGLRIDGKNAIGPLKSMVVDSFTQYNQGGIGVSITNEGYAQLVSIFTICSDTAIICQSGSACDLTNSNSSFGNYGLVADGIGPRKYTGIITAAAAPESDTFVLDLSVPSFNITNAEYDNQTGILTAYTDNPHKFSVGMGITLSGLGFTCPSGPGTLTYPTGNYGYVFETKTVAPGRYVDSFNLIQANRQEIIDTAYNAIGITYPSFIDPNPAKCKRDIGYIVDAVSTDVRDFTSENIIETTKAYFNPDGTLLNNGLLGEIPQAIVGFTSARDLMKLAITNNLTNKDLTLTADPLTGSNTDPASCANIQSFIDNLVGIITTRLDNGDLNTLPLPSVSAASTVFSVNVGPSTLPHTYVSGGTAEINVIRPFDGQVVFFDRLYYTIGKIKIVNPGSGYNSNPEIIISDPSTVNDWGVTATAAAEVQGGSVVGIEIISSGRGYTSIPTVTFTAPDVGINTATAVIELLPTYYSVSKSSLPTPTGICTVTVSENVPYAVGVGTEVPFYKQSRVLASGHSFEYIGSGTDITTALPFAGGVPIQDNEIDMRNGGLVVYTSTDQAGNFRIGEGVAINQLTGTISGRFYSKSLFSTMTPFILALGGD